MVKTLTKLAKFLRPIGKGTDEIIAVKLSSFDITVAEVRVKSNVIHIENIATKPLTRNLNFANLPRQHDMVVDALRDMRDQGLFAAADAGIIIFATAAYSLNRLFNKFIYHYRKAKSSIALRLPIVGDIIVKSTVARMSLLMANLLAAGVSVIDTLEVSRTVSRNVLFLEATERIQQKITSGAALSDLLGNEKVFPLALGQLMAVGERTGNMDEMLTSIAKYYEEEFTTVVDGLSTIIEPLMIVFVGAMIGVMVVALCLPIFSAGDAIR